MAGRDEQSPRARADEVALRVRRQLRDYPDFPRPGILFRDIVPLFRDQALLADVVEVFAEQADAVGAQKIAGIESRGFLFGAPVAYKLGLPFAPVRKAGKLPSERMSVEFALEYGESQLDIHTDALERNQRVVIVDDLLATGGTADAACKLVELLGAYVSALAFVVELSFLNGRERLQGRDIITLVMYDA